MSLHDHLEADTFRTATTAEIALIMLKNSGGEGTTVHAGNTVVNAEHKHAKEQDKALLVGRVSDAWAWLVAHGCVGPDGNSSGGWQRITRAGGELAEDPDGLSRSLGRDLLGAPLLPELERSARPAFDRGDHETASFAAMKAVEVEVRRLGQFDNALLGVKLMQEAFKPGGVLTDPGAEGGEQVATMQLFAGAIGAFKNPASHRTVVFSDPIEAAEVVLLADLLLRILARIEERLVTQ